MSDVVTLQVGSKFSINWKNVRTVAGRTVKDESSHQNKFGFTNGNAAGSVEQIYSNLFTLSAASPTQDFDLIGVLLDVWGFTINAARVILVMCENLSETDGQLIRLGGAGAGNNAWSTPWAGSTTPGDASTDIGNQSVGVLMSANAGFVAAAGSTDVLRVVNVSASEDIDVKLTIVSKTSAP